MRLLRYPPSRLLGRWAVVPLLLLSAHADAAIEWPLSERSFGETSDLIRLVVAVAPAAEIDGEPLYESALLDQFYRRRAFEPAWLDREGVYLAVGDLLEALDQAPLDGLEPGYHLDVIKARMEQSAADPLQLAQLDVLVSDAFLHYSRHLRRGRIEPASVDSDWLIDPEPFSYVAAIERAVGGQGVKATLDAMTPDQVGYRRLRAALARYRAVARRGGWDPIPPGPLLKTGVRDDRVPALRWRLTATGDLLERSVQDPELFGERVEKAVRRLQRRHGLDADGKVGAATLKVMNVPVEVRIDQILLNMERWRWLPRGTPARQLMVNLADYRLSVLQDGLPIREMRVVVGRDERPTPALAGVLDALVLNPYWYVPETVFRKDLLPHIQEDPQFLDYARMKLFRSLEGAGEQVDPATVDWSVYAEQPFPYTLRQDPGPDNALGRVKFTFPNEHGIYLHDTPKHGQFAEQARALSSGCVRVEDPDWLAAYLLSPEEESADSRVDAILEQGTPTKLPIPKPVPIVIAYLTAWVDELNQLNFRDDFYGRDAPTAAALGLPTAGVLASAD